METKLFYQLFIWMELHSNTARERCGEHARYRHVHGYRFKTLLTSIKSNVNIY